MKIGFRLSAVIVIGALACVALGASAGFFWERQKHEKDAINRHLMNVATNLQVAKLIRQGNHERAMETLKAGNFASVSYLMYYEHISSNDVQLQQRKKRVLGELRKELRDFPTKNSAPTGIDEWKDFNTDVMIYLDQSAETK